MRWVVLLIAVALGGCMDPIKQTVGLDDPVTHHEALVRDDPYPDLIVEIDYVEGYAPSELALVALAQTLGEVTGKRTITILEPSRIPSQGGGYDGRDVLAIHAKTIDHRMSDYGHRNAGILHVLYLDGPSKDDTWQGIYVDDGRGQAAAALLPHYWDEAPLVDLGGLPVPRGEFSARFERAVLMHEAGHALGLVGGIPEQRPHHLADDPAHSNNPESAMYTGDVPVLPDTLRFLKEQGIEPVWRYDADDKADLAAFRNG